MAVGGAACRCRALRNARADVFQDRDGGAGDGGGSIVVDAIPIPLFNAAAQRRRVRRECFEVGSLRSHGWGDWPCRTCRNM